MYPPKNWKFMSQHSVFSTLSLLSEIPFVAFYESCFYICAIYDGGLLSFKHLVLISDKTIKRFLKIIKNLMKALKEWKKVLTWVWFVPAAGGCLSKKTHLSKLVVCVHVPFMTWCVFVLDICACTVVIGTWHAMLHLHVHVHADSCAAEAGSLAKLGECCVCVLHLCCPDLSPSHTHTQTHTHTHTPVNFGIWMQMPAIQSCLFLTFFGLTLFATTIAHLVILSSVEKMLHKTQRWSKAITSSVRNDCEELNMEKKFFWNVGVSVSIAYFNSSFEGIIQGVY